MTGDQGADTGEIDAIDPAELSEVRAAESVIAELSLAESGD